MEEKPIPPVKEVEPEDPMEFMGVALPGDSRDAMAECFVEEYVLQGFDDASILRLFTLPFFAGTHAVYRDRGEPYVKDLIARVRAQWGRPRFHTVDGPALPDQEVDHA